uniref:Zinc finger FYVE-type containing 19 n=1 Tax=Catharus ustulatus TaxID=91951 RepID=A0A8C3UDD9_CATUS
MYLQTRRFEQDDSLALRDSFHKHCRTLLLRAGGSHWQDGLGKTRFFSSADFCSSEPGSPRGEHGAWQSGGAAPCLRAGRGGSAMDSRCYGCASKFSVFKKECGCKNCGRSFCSGCRSFSAVVPRCGNTQQKVCKQGCFLFSGLKSLFSIVMYFFHPYHRRVAAFEAKQNQLKDQQKAAAKPPGQAGCRYQGLSKEDRAIAERLERLREERKPKSIPTQAEIEARLAALKEDGRGPVPSTQEMEDRLAVLQGRDPPSQAPRPVHQPPDTRSLVQQTDDLLTQLSEEVAIDDSQSLNDLNRESEDNVCPANLDPKQLEEEKNKLLAEAAAELREENTRQEKILQVAKRLAALKGEDPEKGGFLALCCYQLTEEAALDEASGFNIPPDQTTQPGPSQQNLDEDELPWCCICNEDATLRCHGCDGDLYCQCCFCLFSPVRLCITCSLDSETCVA